MIEIELPSDIGAARERFERMCIPEPNSGCWLWTGAYDYRGYGRFRWSNPRSVLRAHRASFALYVRPPKDGEVVCHRCDNPACVNPDHLFVGTFSDNTQDMMAKARWTKPPAIQGTANFLSKLTEGDVIKIRAASGTLEQIGKRFGVTKGTVGKIRNRKLWQHVP